MSVRWIGGIALTVMMVALAACNGGGDTSTSTPEPVATATSEAATDEAATEVPTGESPSPNGPSPTDEDGISARREELRIDELASLSTDIVIGTVKDIRDEWDAANEVPFTFIDVVVQETPKGEAEATLTIKTTGGTFPDGTVLTAADAAQYTIGEKVLLFLEPAEVDPVSQEVRYFSPLGRRLGKFAIEFDEDSGREIVMRDRDEEPLFLDELIRYLAAGS